MARDLKTYPRTDGHGGDNVHVVVYQSSSIKARSLNFHERIYEPRHEKPFSPYANNKGADQPVHPRSLISTFIVRSLNSCYALTFKTELVSVAEQAGLSLTWSQPPKTDFLVTWRILKFIFSSF